MKKKRANQILDAAWRGRHSAALAALMVVGLLLNGCGQKGPLTLPSAAPVKAKTALPSAAPAPAPAADNILPARTNAALR